METRVQNLVPFGVMLLMEACTIALTIMAKTALTGGMSPFVFIVYTNAFGSLLLLPYSFLFHRDERTREIFISLPLVVRMFFLGFTGVFLFQNFAFLGLSYSSPIVVCAMGLLIPAISFLLSIALRRTRLDWRNPMFQMKVIGTLVSLTGAIVEELYFGPYTRPSPTTSPTSGFLNTISHLFVFLKTTDNWVLGGVLLACASLSVSVWNIIQLDTIQKYPQVMKVVSYYSIAGTIQCAIFSLFMERDLNAWKLKPNMDLLLIIITGIFGSIVRTSVHVKCARMKGPFYVPLFKPFGILWATVFGTSFFVNSLHYGSVLGAAIAGVGYCTVLWAQKKEDEEKMNGPNSSQFSDLNQQKIPLLHHDDDDHV